MDDQSFRLGDHGRYPTKTRGIQILAKSFQIITGLLGTAVRAFALAVLTLQTIWGILLAGLCFWIASQGSVTRGIIAVVLAVILVSVCALVIAFYFASLAVVKKAVSDAALGRSLFDTLFDYALGVSGDDTGERPSTAKIPTHMSRAEVEETLNGAAKRILSDETPTTTLARPFFWLARRIQRISVWATVKVIVTSCSEDGTSVNMFELRDRLASTIDEGIVSHLKQHFTRLAFAAIIAISFISILLALGLKNLPF